MKTVNFHLLSLLSGAAFTTLAIYIMKTQSKFDALQCDRLGYYNNRKRDWKEDTTLTIMAVTATALIIWDLSVNNLLIASMLFATVVAIVLPKETNALFSTLKRWQSKYKVNIFVIAFCLVGTTYLIDALAMPTQAAFLTGAQTFFTTAFNGLGADVGTIVGYVFNILRMLFVIYLAISLVRIVQAARNDEDWQILARTPIIIVVTIFVGDFLIGLITGAP